MPRSRWCARRERHALPLGAQMDLWRRRALQLTGLGPLVLADCLEAAERPIDESGFVRIGGIDQWIAIQGRDIINPAIVHLHGGPAEAQSPFLNQFVPWERHFTVINWDQRGSGKTYGAMLRALNILASAQLD
jgi:hypothetical protein